MAADARDAVRRLPGVGEVTRRPRGPLHGQRRSTPPSGAARGSPGPSRARPRASSTRCASCSSARRSSRASPGCCEGSVGATPASARAAGDLPGPDARAAASCARELGIDASDDAPAFVRGDGDAGARRRGGAIRAHGDAQRGCSSTPTAASAARCCKSDTDDRGGGGMNAARLHEYHQALKLDSVDEPKATGPFDVVVKIGAAGLCRTDLHIQEGQWAEKSEVVLPYTPGHENAGWVHEIGSGVTNVEVGDTVIVHPFISCGLCRPCRRGDDMHCVNGSFPGINRDGGFAEFLLTSARSVVKLDPSLRAGLDRRARRRRADRDPRGQEGDPRARRRHEDRRDRRRRARPHRHPVPEGLHADRDHRRRPEREGARARRGAGRGPHHQGRGHLSTSRPSRS